MRVMEQINLHTVSQVCITECEGVYEIRGYNNEELSIVENTESVTLDGTDIQLEQNGILMVLTPPESPAQVSIENDKKVNIDRVF